MMAGDLSPPSHVVVVASLSIALCWGGSLPADLTGSTGPAHIHWCGCFPKKDTVHCSQCSHPMVPWFQFSKLHAFYDHVSLKNGSPALVFQEGTVVLLNSYVVSDSLSYSNLSPCILLPLSVLMSHFSQYLYFLGIITFQIKVIHITWTF